MSADALSNAIEFRNRVGLQADVEWILKVATESDAAAGVLAYGTPLTATEKATLDARAANAEALAPVVTTYGQQHADEFAGVFVDVPTGTFVVGFTGSLERHRAALDRLVRPGATLEVRQAEWTLADLTARQGQVEADLEWLSSISAWWEGTGVDIVRNRVSLRVSSANPDAARLAIEHYNGAGWLEVESDGIGRWEGPLGNLTIDAVTRSGRPARFLDCVLIPDDPSARYTVGDYGTGETGRCSITGVASTTYEVELRMLPPDGSPWIVVGRTQVGVPALKTESIVVPVDLP